MDITQLPTVVRGQPHNVKLFFAMDLATKKIVAHKIFRVLNNGAIRAKYIVRTLEPVLAARKFELDRAQDNAQTIVHSDRGTEFTSREYAALLERYPFCIGSMSEAHSPNQNAVAERFARTVKQQLLAIADPLPETVRFFREIEEAVLIRIRTYNARHKGKGSLKIPPDLLDDALEKHESRAPDVVVHWPVRKGVTDKHANRITEYRENAIHAFKGRTPMQVLLDTEAHAKEIRSVQSQLEEQSLSLQELHQEVGQIAQMMRKQVPTKKKRRVERPLRDPAGSAVYDFLMSLDRPARTPRRVWARNKVAITLLRFLGLRASELLAIRKEQLLQAHLVPKIDILQPKTGARRIVVLPHAAIKALKSMRILILEAFQGLAPNATLGQSPLKTDDCHIHFTNWRKTLNEFIKRANEKFPGCYSSHSFRVNLVTRLLRSIPVHEVQAVIGHKDIRTTVRYDRYKPAVEKLQAQIEYALEEDRYDS